MLDRSKLITEARRLARHALVGAFALGLAACGGPAGDFCSRLAECNALATGTSEDECKENTERNLDNLSSGRRSDCEKQINDCLEFDACPNYVSCVQMIQGC